MPFVPSSDTARDDRCSEILTIQSLGLKKRLEHATITALKNSGKFIPWQVVTISVDGRILD